MLHMLLHVSGLLTQGRLFGCLCRRLDAEVEEGLEEAYEAWKVRQGAKKEAARRKRQRLGMDGELASDEEEGDGDAAYAGVARAESDEEDEVSGRLTGVQL